MRTVLQICQESAKRLGVPVPTTVSSAPDMQTIQFGALLQEVMEYLIENYNWQVNRYSKTFAAVAAQSQGSIYTLTGQNFKRIVKDTMWNMSLRRSIRGPVQGPERQALQAFVQTGPLESFWIVRDELMINPAPTAGHSISFEWDSKDAWLAQDGTTRRTAFTQDSDTPLLDDGMVILGLRAFWRREKGQAYADLLTQFEALAQGRCTSDGVKQDVNLAGPEVGAIQPGIFIAPGNTVPL